MPVKAGRAAVVQAAETGMRDAIGQGDLDRMPKDRIDRRLPDLPGAAAGGGSIEIATVELKDVDSPEQMQRAITGEAGAIREKRARIIKAGGGNEAARTPAEAAATIASPGALELCRPQTPAGIGVEHSGTIIAMPPVEMVHAVHHIAGSPPAPSG